ncbi:N-acetylglucosamine-1-phosphate uridyltransferase / Glucosamine-1-phosphate N-acetyltransferase [hydrothermal vent metagenome]|uniref:N-acetylglucosamine-1-phosphate uridyltransferase / Glucosamine-1-phosphate N-acetyltransferase n=1 Tax=hydrothermal vent metagenome TaxID=652676 RepID=A0A1W1EHM3_9ZZZZ
MSISIIILSAGKGSRMKSNTPKVLHKISGKPMLFYAIQAGLELSNDITVVLNHKAKLIQNEINAHFSNISYHIQDVDNFPGTGGAIMGIKPKYDRVVILNGDMPLITKSSIHRLISSLSDINMSIISLDNPSGYGRVDIVDNRVKEIIEEKDCNDTQKEIKSVNGGVYALSRDILNRYIPKLNNNNAQKEYYLTDIIKLAVDDGFSVNPIFVDEDEFKGVNSKLDLSKAEIIMQNKIKSNLMKNGVTMRMPDTIYIDSRASFEGEVILENGVTIEGNTTIKSSHIKAHSVIEDSIIDNSSIGPMARIRPNSNIINTHIGNFVEVKKSNLNGVKAGHLSYLGDSDIDSGSNIGAGVITCNYDGKNKYRTTIGKNVFIGSDTQLVAPIRIANDVMIGAGSTINIDIAEGELALSRTPIKRVKNFFYKFFGRE